MKIRVISSREDIETLKDNEEIIHIAFRPSDKDVFSIVHKCPSVKALQIPTSYMKTMSESVKMFLNMKNIDLLEGDVWGHRKDINEYYDVPENLNTRIDELKKAGYSEKDIVQRIEKEFKLSNDFLKYVIKQKA